MLWLAGTQLPAQTGGARMEKVYGRCSECHVKERKDPGGQQQGEVFWTMAELWSGSDVLRNVTQRT